MPPSVKTLAYFPRSANNGTANYRRKMRMRHPFSIGKLVVIPLKNTLNGPLGSTEIEPKAMQLLCRLAQANEEIAKRIDIIDDLWASQEIGDEILTRYIYLLRKAIQRVSGEAQLIKTVPKVGYALTEKVTLITAPVESGSSLPPEHRLSVISTPASTDIEATSPPASHFIQRWKNIPRYGQWALLFSTIAMLAIALIALRNRAATPLPSETTAWRASSSPGPELMPDISPDGRLITYAGYNEDTSISHIFVRRVFGLDEWQVSDGDSLQVYPRFSPDSSMLAYVDYSDKKCSIFVTPVEKGASRFITECPIGPLAIDWAPNGKTLAVTQQVDRKIAIAEVDLAQNQKTLLNNNDNTPVFGIHPQFTGDGQHICFFQGAADSRTIACYNRATHEVKNITDVLPGPLGFTLLPSNDDVPAVIVGLSAIDKHWLRLIHQKKSRDLKIDGAYPAIDSSGKLLAYAKISDPTGLYRVKKQNDGLVTEPLFASTARDHDPVWVLDDRFVVFSSDRSGFEELWIGDAAANPCCRQITNFRAQSISFLNKSANGEKLLFTVAQDNDRYSIIEMEIKSSDQFNVRELLTSANNIQAPLYSQDGKSIYYAQPQANNTSWQIWQMTLDDKKTTTQLTQDGGRFSQWSANGRLIYENPAKLGLWQLYENNESVLVETFSKANGASWRVIEDHIVYFELPSSGKTKNATLCEISISEARQKHINTSQCLVEFEHPIGFISSFSISKNGEYIIAASKGVQSDIYVTAGAVPDL